MSQVVTDHQSLTGNRNLELVNSSFPPITSTNEILSLCEFTSWAIVNPYNGLKAINQFLEDARTNIMSALNIRENDSTAHFFEMLRPANALHYGGITVGVGSLVHFIDRFAEEMSYEPNTESVILPVFTLTVVHAFQILSRASMRRESFQELEEHTLKCMDGIITLLARSTEKRKEGPDKDRAKSIQYKAILFQEIIKSCNIASYGRIDNPKQKLPDNSKDTALSAVKEQFDMFVNEISAVNDANFHTLNDEAKLKVLNLVRRSLQSDLEEDTKIFNDSDMFLMGNVDHLNLAKEIGQISNECWKLLMATTNAGEILSFGLAIATSCIGVYLASGSRDEKHLFMVSVAAYIGSLVASSLDNIRSGKGLTIGTSGHKPLIGSTKRLRDLDVASSND